MCGVLCSVLVVFLYDLSSFYIHLSGGEKASCFTLIVILVLCVCLFIFVLFSFPHGGKGRYVI